jgi:phytoene dehydrogenase-like protein
MTERHTYNAIVVGSGPNGLAAAITLAQAGLSVVVFEIKSTIGGGMRSAELTLPGFVHDVCSAIHPLGIGSPFFRALPLARHGLEWIHPLAPVAHPFDNGTAALLERSIDATSETLDTQDATAYRKLMEPLVRSWDSIADDLLGPLHLPRHPVEMARFGLLAIRPARSLAKRLFKGERARGLFAGLAAHSIMPLDRSLTAAFGLILGVLGHTVGWPMPRGGSQRIADALGSYFRSLGGEIVTSVPVESIDDLPSARAVLLDVTPRQLIRIAGHRLPSGYRHRLEDYRYGPGVFKVDFALRSPIPWKASECARAGTVHIGGTLEEIAESEREVWKGNHPEKPYVLVAQQTLFDSTRAPQGKHTAWAYCHVPNGSTFDMTERIESQIERFAPGFRDCIIARSTRSPIELEQYNPNYVGGDINGGVQDILQLFTRPVARIVPYSTPVKGLYICSSSTPPGGGVHGMCGYHAARAALKECFR